MYTLGAHFWIMETTICNRVVSLLYACRALAQFFVALRWQRLQMLLCAAFLFAGSACSARNKLVYQTGVPNRLCSMCVTMKYAAGE